MPQPDVANALKSQWFYACTGGTANDYPYGNVSDGLKCNGWASGKATSVDVGSMSACIGGVPGLDDMSGR